MPAVPGFPANVKSKKETAGTRAILEYQYRSICRGGQSIMELIAQEGFNPHEYISFFNLRSFDRIPLTDGIVKQEQVSGIDTVKADIALGLELNGLGSFGKQDVSVSSSATGDPMDDITLGASKGPQGVRKLATTMSKSKTSGLNEMFDWNESTKPEGKIQKLSQVLGSFDNAVQEGKVSETVSQHGMMTGENVFDQKWDGDEKEAVKNFVSEELYIHTKVIVYSGWTDCSL
jgi:phospholipase D1/2